MSETGAVSIFTIEMLAPAHAGALDALTRRALILYPTAFSTDHRQIDKRPSSWMVEHLSELQKTRDFRLGAFNRQRELIGTIRLARRSGPRVEHAADVLFTFVCPEYQKLGVGAALLARLIDEARAIDGLQQLELSVSRDAVGAFRLYRKFGFEETGVLRRQIRHQDRYYDLVTMWLGL